MSYLAHDHEIAVHVHPREFGHKHDQLAELSAERQRELIETTRKSVADAAGLDTDSIVSFRAGRHSASEETFEVLADLGFEVDASINVRYTDYLPSSLTDRAEPFYLDNGLLEVPTTYYRPSVLSRVGLRIFPQRELTATANTLRTDTPLCSGKRAVQELVSSVDEVSMYMHPYDATEYHDMENDGSEFRSRLEWILSEYDSVSESVTANDLRR